MAVSDGEEDDLAAPVPKPACKEEQAPKRIKDESEEQDVPDGRRKRLTEHANLCTVEVPLASMADEDDAQADRVRKASLDAMLLGNFMVEKIPSFHPLFTNSQPVKYQGQRVPSYRWECTTCVPSCGLRGRVLETGPATALVQYLSGSLTEGHSNAPEHRSVNGAIAFGMPGEATSGRPLPSPTYTSDIFAPPSHITRYGLFSLLGGFRATVVILQWGYMEPHRSSGNL